MVKGGVTEPPTTLSPLFDKGEVARNPFMPPLFDKGEVARNPFMPPLMVRGGVTK